MWAHGCDVMEESPSLVADEGVDRGAKLTPNAWSSVATLPTILAQRDGEAGVGVDALRGAIGHDLPPQGEGEVPNQSSAKGSPRP